MLYDGNFIAKETNMILIDDSEETLMLEGESRCKIFLVSNVNPTTESSNASPVKVDVPSELPKVSLVNASLKKLKFHLAQFDFVVKSRTTPNVITEGEWGFEHTKAVFINEIIIYFKSLKEIFNVFDKDLLNEITEVQTVFDQMETDVQQYSVDKRCLEIANKQALNENDRLLEQFISQDIMNIVVNSSVDINASVNVNVNSVETCNKCLELEAELIKQHNMVEKDKFNKLAKNYSQLEQHCISLELAMQLNKEIFQKNNTSTYKQLYDLIKPSLVRAKEQSESLVNQLNEKSVEISDLNAQLQEKVFVITTLKNDLRKLKGKDIVDNAAQMLNATNIDPGMYKLYLVPLAPMVKNDRESHIYYLKHTMEQAAILREIVEQAKSLNPLNSASYTACKYVKLIQELLGYVRDTCPDIHIPSKKLVAVTPINKKKTVRFAKPVTSSSNIPKVSNRPLLSSTGVKPSTSASGLKPSGNTKNDRILRTPSSNEKNKVEAQSRKVKSSLNKKNFDSKNVCNEHVKHFVKGAKALCSICNECTFDANHAMCLIDHVNSMNMRAKHVSKKKEWKPTGKVLNSVGYKWMPTERTFTLVRNAYPLTRITATNKVPIREPIPLKVVAQDLVVTKVYTRRPKVVQIVLWYLDSGCSKHMTGDRSQLTNFVHKFLGTVKFDNDQVAKIMGYGDYQIGNITISRVYYVEGLGHNLFSVGQLCDSDLEVAFRKHTCFIRNLEGVDLLSISRGTNLYSLSIGDMMASSPICLLLKATKTKSWLWHSRLSRLNFGAINHLAKGLVKFLASKDEAPDFIIKFMKMIQVRLNATVRNIRTDNVPILAVEAPAPVKSIGTPSSTIVDQDAPSLSTSQTTS
ncbi:hypothetical protein Tco_1292393 [Tanacetum coccineum]